MTNDIKSEASQADGTEPSEAQKTIAAECWLAEFEGLRNLVLNFQRMQHNLIWVNISAIGIILTIYFVYTSDVILLLAIPIVSNLLGIYWVAQGIQTSQVGLYIKNKVAPALQTLSLDQAVMGWESHIRMEMGGGFSWKKPHRIFTLRRIPRAVAGLIFVVPSVVALVMTALVKVPVPLGIQEVVWWSGLVLSVLLIIYGLKLGQYWIGG